MRFEHGIERNVLRYRVRLHRDATFRKRPAHKLIGVLLVFRLLRLTFGELHLGAFFRRVGVELLSLRNEGYGKLLLLRLTCRQRSAERHCRSQQKYYQNFVRFHFIVLDRNVVFIVVYVKRSEYAPRVTSRVRPNRQFALL